MTVLQEADELLLGETPVEAAYAGAEQVWPSGFDPLSLAGLTVWVDAAQLELADGAALSSWPNLGSGGDGAIVGTPAPVLRANALNGLPVVRFTASEGRVRGNGMCVHGSIDLTVLYVARLWWYNTGRIFSGVYPPYNFLVGAHVSLDEWVYDNGAAGSGVAWTLPSAWKLYECISRETPRESYNFVNGVYKGMTLTSSGHDERWCLSGYDPSVGTESCDCEVAELLVYDRTLATEERLAAEAYLFRKWGIG